MPRNRNERPGPNKPAYPSNVALATPQKRKERTPTPVPYYEQQYTFVTATTSRSTLRPDRHRRIESQSTDHQAILERMEERLLRLEEENAQMRAAQALQGNPRLI